MVPILLDFTPQLDFAAASYAMEEERTEQGWFAMEESRWSRGDAPWRGERMEQRRPLLRQDSAAGRSPPPSPAAYRGPAATDRVLPGVEREGEEELRQWRRRQCR